MLNMQCTLLYLSYKTGTMLFLSCFIGPTFDVSINSDTTSVYPWETAKMVCDVSVSGTSPTTGEYTHK